MADDSQAEERHLFDLHSTIIEVLESKYLDNHSYPSASMELLGLKIMMISPTGLTAARNCMMCVHSIVSNVWFDAREPVATIFGKFAFIMLELFGRDMYIRVRAFTVIRILNFPESLHDASFFINDMLSCRHVSASHQLNILGILQSIAVDNDSLKDPCFAGKVDALYESVRQYIIFALTSHPNNGRIQETCCALLMEIRAVEVVVDSSLLHCLQAAFQRFPDLAFVAMAVSYFVSKTPAEQVERSHVVAIISVLDRHADDYGIALLAAMALNNCVVGCNGAALCSKTMEFCDHLLTTYSEVSVIQRHLISLISCSWDWGCPHPRAQFGPRMGGLIDRVCSAQARNSDDLNIHVSAARICTQSLLGLTSVPTFMKASYMVAMANAALNFQKHVMIIVMSFRCLSAYYSLTGAVPMHGVLSKSLLATIKNKPNDMDVIMASLCLLGGVLRLCDKEDAELHYSPIVEQCMDVFLLQAKTSSGIVVMMSRVLTRWSELCGAHAAQYLDFTLTLPGLLEESSHFSPVISTIRCMLNSMSISVATAEAVVSSLGALITSERSPMIIVGVLDTFLIVFRKCPKCYKKFTRTRIFRLCKGMASCESEDAVVRRLCSALVQFPSCKASLSSIVSV